MSAYKPLDKHQHAQEVGSSAPSPSALLSSSSFSSCPATSHTSKRPFAFMESRAIPSTLPRANAGQHASKLARSGKKGCRERGVKGRRRASSTSKKRRPPYSKANLEEPGYGYEPLLFLTRRGEERDEKYLAPSLDRDSAMHGGAVAYRCPGSIRGGRWVR